MTEILAAPHSGHRVASKLQETRLKGHWLQDDTDSLEFDKLLAELQKFPEEHSVQSLYKDGLSFAHDDIDVKGSEGDTKAGNFNYTHSELGINFKMLNDSHKNGKQLQSKVKNMPVVENVDKNIEHAKSFSYDTQQIKQDVQVVNKITDQFSDSKNSKNGIVQKNKAQANIINTKSKPQTPGVNSSFVDDSHSSKFPVVSANAAPAATFSLAELAKQHKSQRARVASGKEAIPVSKASVEDLAKVSFTFRARDQTEGRVVGSLSNCSDSFVASLDSRNGKLSKQNATSTVVGCSSSAGSLTEPPAANPYQAATSSGVSLSQLALQHRQSKPPLSTVLPGNGYVNGCKPSLLQLMKNVALDDCKTSTPAAAPYIKVPSVEPGCSLSLTLCLKVNKPSDTSSKLLCGEQTPDPVDLGVSNIITLMDSQPGQADADSQEQAIPTELIPHVSSTGFVLCCLKRKRKLADSSSSIRNALKYPKFMCGRQIGHENVYPESVYHKIQPFDFSTPSPDDLVKHKQKQAFTRPQKEFEF